MKILVISSLYPNPEEPYKGIFVSQQIRELSRMCPVKVIAPVPWAPPFAPRPDWRRFSRVPRSETRDGIEIMHPRHIVIPKIGRTLYGMLLSNGIAPCVEKLRPEFDFDLVLAYFAYPDGFAAGRIAEKHHKPCCVVALGSDIKVYTEHARRRRLTVKTLNAADAVIAVSIDLARTMKALGVNNPNMETLTNGIDTSLFAPAPMLECRKKLELPRDGGLLLFVGNLKPVKGVETLIRSFADLRKKESAVHLAVVGDGELKASINDLARELGIENNVTLAGARAHSEIALWMNSCDVFCLPSLSEGCPNVVLEAMACGKPVVASSVGGIPDMVKPEHNGFLVAPGDVQGLSAALQQALHWDWNAARIRAAVDGFSWKENAARLHAMLERIVANYKS